MGILLLHLYFIDLFVKVVGSIDQVGVVDEVKPEKDSETTYDSKNADKPKTRKLYVGSQALGYRRDQMEVRSYVALSIKSYFLDVDWFLLI